MQKRHVYIVFQGFLAMYHPEVRVAWVREGKMNAAKAEEFYVAYCEYAVPLTRLQTRNRTKVLLAWAVCELRHIG